MDEGRSEYYYGDYLTKADVIKNGHACFSGAMSKMVTNDMKSTNKLQQALHKLAYNNKFVADIVNKQNADVTSVLKNTVNYSNLKIN